MDSQKLFGYNVAGGDSTHISTQYGSPTVRNRLFGPLKYNFKDSPISPFSTHFDCDTVTTLSDSRENQSSSEGLSAKSNSCNSPLETNSYYQKLNSSPSEDSHQSPFLRTSSGTLFSRKTEYEVNM